ncbi:DUF2336 domain-containing protein [Lichenibacterium dinghuense]|uniref:DUF2336 domain-containing protein n=1 Tax=Lichenibacterium dinghuense TaxID=2895977 RepID=UPI001F43C1E7|nr:DUF2336 domain-containing protein [Lichenibacterium sp. 6Y81]
MLSRQFLSWAERAPAGDRAEAAGNLARACLYAELDPIERGEMERTLTCLLDDASPLVRRALAEALAGAAEAPHHLVATLANDQADIAAPVLARSPLLTDAELIDAAALGEGPAQCAIASRPNLSAAVAGALAEVGSLDAVLVLCRNPAAALADISIRRILERFGRDGDVREALGARADLGPALRHDLVVATADALRDFVTGCGWMAPERARRVAADEADRAAVGIAGRHVEGDLGRLRFAGALRRAGRLTPALIIRALLSGDLGLFEACLAELAGQPLSRVSGLVRRHDGLAFAALVRSAGLPDGLLPVLRTALEARRPAEAEVPAMLRRDVVARVLARCSLDADLSVAGLTALLRRFESEAARAEGRASAPAPRAGADRRIEPSFGAAPEPVIDLDVAA